MSTVLSLRFLLDEGRFIKHPFNPDAPIGLPAFTQGDVIPVRLYAYARTEGNQSRIVPQDISTLNPELALGSPGERPELGFWLLTFGANTTVFIPVSAQAESVQTAVNAISSMQSIGGVDVEGEPCNFILTCRNVGAQSDPSVIYDGNVQTSIRVVQVNAGDAESPAQWRVQILAAAAAFTTSWSAGSVTPTSTVTSLGDNLWRVNLDPNAEGGFFKLAVTGAPSTFISLFASPIEIQNAVGSIAGNLGDGAQMIPDQSGAGTFLLALGNSGTLTISDSTLQIPPSLLGSLDLTGAGIEQLLDGAAFQGVELSVMTDGAWTNANTAAILRKSASPTPGTSDIPNPPMGTPVSNVRYLPSVTGHTGGGLTNLDGVYTVASAIGTLVQFIIPGPPDIVEMWELKNDPSYPTASDPSIGIVAPLDASTSNQKLWLQRQ